MGSRIFMSVPELPWKVQRPKNRLRALVEEGQNYIQGLVDLGATDAADWIGRILELAYEMDDNYWEPVEPDDD